MSDHYIISFCFQCEAVSSLNYVSGYVFDFCKADLDCLCSYLLDVDFSACFLSSDSGILLSHSPTYEAMHLYIPKVHLKSRNSPKWFDSEIRHHLNCPHTLRRKYNSHPTPHQLSKLKFSEETLQKKMVSAKSEYEANLLKSFLPNNKTSMIYSSAMAFHQLSILIPALLVLIWIRLRYLMNTFIQCSPPVPSNFLLLDRPEPVSCLSDLTITTTEVYQGLSSLDPGKAMGCDGIGPKLLKHCALALYEPSHHFFPFVLHSSGMVYSPHTSHLLIW